MHEEQSIKLFSSVFFATGEETQLLPFVPELDMNASLTNRAFIAVESHEEIFYKGEFN